MQARSHLAVVRDPGGQARRGGLSGTLGLQGTLLGLGGQLGDGQRVRGAQRKAALIEQVSVAIDVCSDAVPHFEHLRLVVAILLQGRQGQGGQSVASEKRSMKPGSTGIVWMRYPGRNGNDD